MFKLSNNQLLSLGEMSMIFEEYLGGECPNFKCTLELFDQGNYQINVKAKYYHKDYPNVDIRFMVLYRCPSAGPGYESSCVDDPRDGYPEDVRNEYHNLERILLYSKDSREDEIYSQLTKVRKLIQSWNIEE